MQRPFKVFKILFRPTSQVICSPVTWVREIFDPSVIFEKDQNCTTLYNKRILSCLKKTWVQINNFTLRNNPPSSL